MKRQAAVFLDRDGTLIEDPGFLRDPSLVRPLPGAVRAVARLTRAGFLPIIVTNQSGIGRGLISDSEYRAVAARVEAELSAEGGRIAATFHCPHAPAITGPCGCRKPGTDLYCEASRRFDLELTRCWWVGDRLTDVEPATVLGGRAILIAAPGDPVPDAARAGDCEVAPNIAAAAAVILADQEKEEEA